jgi:hypothetical protein
LSAVDVCALKESKVTPAYLTATLKGGKFTVDDVRLLRAQNVPEDFPAASAASGKNYNAQELANLSAYGVGAQEILAWASLPYPFGPAQIAKFHTRGTRPEYVAVALAVFENIKPEDIIKLNALGVSTNDIAASKTLGLDIPELINLQLHGVSSAEIGVWKKVRPTLSSDDLVQLHINQVPPAYAALFYSTNMQAADVIRLKQVQVPAEEAVQWIAAGYPYGASDLVRLHVAKVPPEYAAGAYIPGRLHLSTDVMIRYWLQGLTAEEIRSRRR